MKKQLWLPLWTDGVFVFFFYLFNLGVLCAYRLAGATLIAPVVNYWWPRFPANLSKEAYYLQLPQDQWTLRVAHYTPCLFYWWNTQKLFPASAVVARKPEVFSRQDLELFSTISASRTPKVHIFSMYHYKSLVTCFTTQEYLAITYSHHIFFSKR